MIESGVNRERSYYIDWIRIVAFGLLIVYHVGMYYVSWPWHIKSQMTVKALEPWMLAINPWRMDLLFIVSGFASLAMFQKTDRIGKFLSQRFTRLLIPLVFGVLVIVPPQTYFEVIEKYSYEGSYLQFLSYYYSGGGDMFCEAQNKCAVMPTWNHLWYLPYLLAYTVCAAFLATIPKQLWKTILVRMDTATRPYWIFIIPILYLALTRIALRDSYPPTHALIGDWFQHAQYFFMFLCGAYLYKSKNLPQRIVSMRKFGLLSALACYYIFQRLVELDDQALLPLVRFVYSGMQWSILISVFGFAIQHLNHSNKTLRYLTEAVFPVYILHQTIIMIIAKSVRNMNLDLRVEIIVLVTGTSLFCLLGYECIRRTNLLRPLFGLKSLHSVQS